MLRRRSKCCAAVPIDSAWQQFAILLCTHNRQSHSATLASALVQTVRILQILAHGPVLACLPLGCHARGSPSHPLGDTS
jgi:hypothetical protein